MSPKERDFAEKCLALMEQGGVPKGSMVKFIFDLVSLERDAKISQAITSATGVAQRDAKYLGQAAGINDLKIVPEASLQAIKFPAMKLKATDTNAPDDTSTPPVKKSW